MTDAQRDWRLMGQERYLEGAALEWKRYHAWSDRWDHDHCEFCGAKFMEPPDSVSPPEVLTEGYSTTAEHERGAEYYWVCKQCFEDFADRFKWRVVGKSA